MIMLRLESVLEHLILVSFFSWINMDYSYHGDKNYHKILI